MSVAVSIDAFAWLCSPMRAALLAADAGSARSSQHSPH